MLAPNHQSSVLVSRDEGFQFLGFWMAFFKMASEESVLGG
jgi:hypothetical protein